ncbi:CBS domain-containing protein [Legionella yabuuchiae]|uniref:CBS domain-containing protein n=1 Tax=Legionella yabuuchiae TaxID=376727 RepID=UPI001056CCCC|nr:CBS domain-containing protein [Legionella yabuuchiae]
MHVRDIMTYSPEYVTTNNTIIEAASKMKKFDTGFLPVVDETTDEIVGTVTDRDIIINGLADKKEATTPVKSVMDSDVYYCFETDKVEEATQKMKNKQIHRLMVLNDDKNLLGVISLGDIASHYSRDELVGEALKQISRP